jgi:L-alanine-DL-glutamate epimerase-like enolase superfamily enzyme
MARLAKIDSFIVDLPTIRPHVLAMATMHRQSMVIVRITDADGGEGIGEGTTIGGLSYGDESPEGIKLAIDTYIAPLLETIDIAASARRWRWWANMWWATISPNAPWKPHCSIWRASALACRSAN